MDVSKENVLFLFKEICVEFVVEQAFREVIFCSKFLLRCIEIKICEKLVCSLRPCLTAMVRGCGVDNRASFICSFTLSPADLLFINSS